MISSTRTLKEEEEEEVGNGTPSQRTKKKENECTIDRCHIRDLSLAKFNRKYREKKPVVVTFDTKFDEEEKREGE